LSKPINQRSRYINKKASKHSKVAHLEIKKEDDKLEYKKKLSMINIESTHIKDDVITSIQENVDENIEESFEEIVHNHAEESIGSIDYKNLNTKNRKDNFVYAV
jgi:hypothetical protein